MARRIGYLIKLAGRLVWLRFSKDTQKTNQGRRILFDGFKHLGGVYIKFLQLLALNVDYMKGWAGPSEFDVFEAVSLEEINLTNVLDNELPHWKESFLQIEPVPFAAGSFAQVYRARLLDHSEVVIKVLRPGLARTLKQDLRLLGIVARLGSWLFPTDFVDIRSVYKVFVRTTLLETDYKKELSNAQWFHKYYENTPDIIIPKTYSTLSSTNIITQEFIGGISLADVMLQVHSGADAFELVKRQLGSDLGTQLTRLGAEALSTSLLADYVMGDPHPGNIKLLPNNKVGVIDFGIIASAPLNRDGWLGLMYEYQNLYHEQFKPGSFALAALNYYDESLVQSLTVVGRDLQLYDPAKLFESIGASAEEFFREELRTGTAQALFNRKMMSQLFTQVVNKANRFGVHLNSSEATFYKSAQTYLSLVGTIAGNDRKTEIIRDAIDATIACVEAADYRPTSLTRTVDTEEALEVVGSWFARIADKDPFLYGRLTANINLYG